MPHLQYLTQDNRFAVPDQLSLECALCFRVAVMMLQEILSFFVFQQAVGVRCFELECGDELWNLGEQAVRDMGEVGIESLQERS